MTGPVRGTDGTGTATADPVARLAQLGVERPPSCTVRRLLTAAAAEGLLPGDAVEEYLEHHDRAVHGAGGGDVAAVRAPLVAALAAVTPDDPRLTALAVRLRPDAPSPRRRVIRPVAVNRLEPTLEPEPEAVPEEAVAVTSARRATARRSRRRWLWLALAGWTLVAMVVGAAAGPLVVRGVRAAGARWLGWRVGDSARLAILLQQAGEAPEEDARWQRLVGEARRLERWDVVMVGLRHLAARHPDDAEQLNELAWMLLTVPEPWLRSPSEALAVAERAHALNPSSNIIDTLAEAAYQTGDPHRAVGLELVAISKAAGNHAFLDRQLAKFRAAARAADR